MKNNLKKYLKENDISAYSLATEMKVKPQYVHYYKNAKNLSPSIMNKIAKALKVDVNLIFEL